MSDMLQQPLDVLAGHLRTGRVSARDLTEQVLERQRLSALNAYRHPSPSLARSMAAAADRAFHAGRDHGPLQGLQVSIKDLFGVAGLPTYAGTRRRLPPEWEREGPVVTDLRRQHGVIVGKTHCGELALGGLGYCPHGNTPRNPWDPDCHRVPGGSSSGAGVSLWEGSALLALGSDTGGSVRVPASFTGCVGLKITHGRWSTDGMVPLTTLFDTPGLLTRTVGDMVFAFAALDPWYPDIPLLEPADLRLGLAHDCLWEDCDPAILMVVRHAIDELSAHGARLRGPLLPQAATALDLIHSGGVAASDCHSFVSSRLPHWQPLLGRHISGVLAEGAAVEPGELQARRERYRQLSRTAVDCFQSVDVMLAPTVRIPPPPLSELSDLDRYRQLSSAALSNCVVANLLGLCALTLPVGLDDRGLPVGLQLMAAGGDETRLLAAALAVEQVLGTARERLGKNPF